MERGGIFFIRNFLPLSSWEHNRVDNFETLHENFDKCDISRLIELENIKYFKARI